MSTEKPTPILNPNAPPKSVLAGLRAARETAPAATAPTAPKRSLLADRRAASQRLDMTPPPLPPPPDATPEPKKYYSASQRGFYSEEIHGAALPADAVEITPEAWQQLLHAQNHDGKQIVPGPDGKPIAVNQVVTPEMQRHLIEAQIDQLRRAPDTLDLARAAALGKPGAAEQLAAVDRQIEALRATMPPA